MPVGRYLISLLLSLALSTSGLRAQYDVYGPMLRRLCDALLKVQIRDSSSPNFGAMVCPSVNPEVARLHSRAGEAVYPLAIAFRSTGDRKYLHAAVSLGDWLLRIQDSTGKRAGGWSEEWPDPGQKFWYGTTTDQLISLAGAYPVLRPYLDPARRARWSHGMSEAANYILRFFPLGSNINYSATGATTLLLAYRSVDRPDPRWLIKADSLMYQHTLPYIETDGLLHGEGLGVDGGYNIAQSIGYIALFGMLKGDSSVVSAATRLLRAHLPFIYPDGSMDNSWGTRSFKWLYESGTKTAPGLAFSFALLADNDPIFRPIALKCLQLLEHSLTPEGWVGYGPHAHRHASTSPPCLYGTFARAQSVALAVAYGSPSSGKTMASDRDALGLTYFPSLKVAVVRTRFLKATISAYGAIGRYPRASVCRGGSITNLWMSGYGGSGFAQSSSSGEYRRLEPMHMPVEEGLMPLTPRIETDSAGRCYANIYEDSAQMMAEDRVIETVVITKGRLWSADGHPSDVRYRLSHRFRDAEVVKEYSIQGGGEFRIIEPLVQASGAKIRKTDPRTVVVTFANGRAFQLRVEAGSAPFTLSLGENESSYWCPFPGVDAWPVVIRFSSPGQKGTSVKLIIGPVKS